MLRYKMIKIQNPLPKGAEKRYHFSDFTITLNEEESGVAPTDSRLRKDQRLMEETKWDEANAEKQVRLYYFDLPVGARKFGKFLCFKTKRLR